jgi:hypothetical protein
MLNLTVSNMQNTQDAWDRYTSLRNAVLVMLEFKAGSEAYPRIRDCSESRTAIRVLEKAVKS